MKVTNLDTSEHLEDTWGCIVPNPYIPANKDTWRTGDDWYENIKKMEDKRKRQKTDDNR